MAQVIARLSLSDFLWNNVKESPRTRYISLLLRSRSGYKEEGELRCK